MNQRAPLLLFLLSILAIFPSVLNAQSYAGLWSVIETVNAVACGEGTYQDSYTATVTENGGQLSVSANGISRSGTLSGDSINYSVSYPEDGGTTNANGSITFNGTTASGNSSWTWTGNGQSCGGTSSLSASKIAGEETDPDAGTIIDDVPPGNQMAYSVIGNKLTISWSEVIGATGYLLYYAPYPSADPISSIDMGELLGVSGELPIGTSLYIAIQPYNSFGGGGISNVEYFVIEEPASTADTATSIITVKPDTLGMISQVPPNSIYITDLEWENVSHWNFYIGETLIEELPRSRCLQRKGDTCNPFLGYIGEGVAAWNHIADITEWGDQIAVNIKGVNYQGEIISETNTTHIWTYVPNRMQFTLSGEATVYYNNIESPHAGYKGEFEWFAGRVLIFLPEAFKPGIPLHFICPDDNDPKYPELYIKAPGSTSLSDSYKAHGKDYFDSDCSGTITSGALPMSFSNGYVWDIQFDAKVKRVVDSQIETKTVTGQANFMEFITN